MLHDATIIFCTLKSSSGNDHLQEIHQFSGWACPLLLLSVLSYASYFTLSPHPSPHKLNLVRILGKKCQCVWCTRSANYESMDLSVHIKYTRSANYDKFTGSLATRNSFNFTACDSHSSWLLDTVTSARVITKVISNKQITI